MTSETPTESSKKKSFFLSFLFVLVTITFVGGSVYLLYTYKTNQAQVLSASAPPPLDNPIAGQEITKNFTIILPDNNAKIQYEVQKAELRKSLIINRGQSTVTPGNNFLVVYLKLTNASSQPVQVKTSEYAALRVGDKINTSSALLSNDPVSLKPSAIEYARLVFSVNETDRQFLLEIQKGNDVKEALPLTLK